MSLTIGNEYGNVTIEEGVVERIAVQAAMECYGVVGLAARGPKDDIYHLLRLENMSRGVRVSSDAQQGISIQLHVILEAGIRLSMVAENIIDTVRYNVESKTHLTVHSVDVLVQGLRV
ncbi:Asp23/Gls24 family envelope stress response protein [Murdochiella massiliensis]|uniref:Asp23/Gls24 family envelope stress response protein n=1 Tax=Murdochiella massiliensis TaxID=1673723 RepID=UPI0008322A15|nr:Asp23/Gls24 family envelope stress response protein [Murdochiella massiliensis]MBY0584369.1 Asp23/Gls24 family envelope stress response protein [Murdochiella sp. Marseille-P8839]